MASIFSRFSFINLASSSFDKMLDLSRSLRFEREVSRDLTEVATLFIFDITDLFSASFTPMVDLGGFCAVILGGFSAI